MAKIGLLTMYNQDWAVTRYVDRFLHYFGSEQVVVLAEQVAEERRVREDSAAVHRCWKRTSTDYRSLLDTIAAQAIDVLHVNCVFPFFDSPQFAKAINELRLKGVRVVAHVLDTNALATVAEFLAEQADAVVVDNYRVFLEATTVGISRRKLIVIPSGVDQVRPDEKSQKRQELGIPAGQKMAVCFDFGLPEAKLEDIVTAVYQLQADHADLHLYVMQIDAGTGFDGGYAEQLKKKIESLHLDHFVHFVEDQACNSILSLYLGAADVALMSASRPQYEAREVLGVALECATPLVSVGAMPFSGMDSLVYASSASNPLVTALGAVLSTSELQSALGEGSRHFAKENSGAAIAERFARLNELVSGKEFSVLENPELTASQPMGGAQIEQQAPAIISNKLRILMLNRSNAITHRGGDTVVMERITDGLRTLGHQVDIDLEGSRNPADYDVAHLYNFAIREATEAMARRCYDAKTPYVVTTMYEDWPKFYNQMANHYYALKAYVEVGQPAEKWQELSQAAKAVQAAPAWDNTWTAHHSAALIASGTYEVDSLRRDYPQTPRIEIYRAGHEVSEFNDDGELFRKETGLSDFVLCVGRLEWRKNQLMLLKALEESDLTVVFAASGFTYQPEYEQMCRAFRRKGKTVYLQRLSPELLASAFSAARVHALPSWFELPGLVSLEAAHHQTNVVVSDYGTIRDYLGAKAYYCSPDDDESILNAVTAAYYAPARSGLREQVSQFTWERTVEGSLDIYRKVLGSSEGVATAQTPQATSARVVTPSFDHTLWDANDQSQSAKESVARIPEVVGSEPADVSERSVAVQFCVAGDAALIKGDYAKARNDYNRALEHAPKMARAKRSLGVVCLTEQQHDQAEPHFRAALREDPRDVKSLIGLGAVQWERNEKVEAFELYLRAAENEPGNVSCLLYLVNASYELNRLNDLENALRRFLTTERQNPHIQYCLAGCYFRQEKYARAEGVLERMLLVDPANADALELREEIRKRQNSDSSVVEEVPGLLANGTIRTFDAPPVREERSGPTIATRMRQLEEIKRRKDYASVIREADSMLKDPSASASQKALIGIIKGEALACTGEPTLADSEFARAMSDRVYAYRACTGRAALAASLEQWDEAEKLFHSALEAQENYDPAIAGLGIVAMSRDDHEKAWGYFSHALSLNCENMQALLGLTQLGYSMQRLPDTEKALIEYLDIHPVDLPIVYTYAGCLYAQGQKEAAAERCRTILIFDPTHELALELLTKIESEDTGVASAQAS